MHGEPVFQYKHPPFRLLHFLIILVCVLSEMARRERQRKSRRQRWIWGSIATAAILGASALAWSYLPLEKSSSTHNDQVSEQGDAA